MSIPITVAADAAAGPRELVLASGSARVAFSDPQASRFHVAAGAPRIDSIAPILANQGTTLTLIVRGANLQQATVTAAPSGGIVFDSAPAVNSTGAEITLGISLAPDAPLGSRVVRVTTPGGTTSGDASPANTFTVFPGE